MSDDEPIAIGSTLHTRLGSGTRLGNKLVISVRGTRTKARDKAKYGIQKVIWTFFESPETGKVGASKPLQEALTKAGIETQIIR